MKDDKYYEEIQCKLDEIKAGYEHLIINNLEVNIYFSSPLCYIGYFYLEGALQYPILKNLIGQNITNLDQDRRLYIPIPMEWKGKERKYPACTCGLFEEDLEGVTRWRKRWDSSHDDYVKFNATARIAHKAGFFKAYDMPLVYHSNNKVTFFCRGSEGIIRDLLSQFHFMGKKRSQGYGKIKKFEIDKIKEDYSTVKDGILMRPVPAFELLDNEKYQLPPAYNMTLCAYKPPYHWVENMDMCLLPGSEINIKEMEEVKL